MSGGTQQSSDSRGGGLDDDWFGGGSYGSSHGYSVDGYPMAGGGSVGDASGDDTSSRGRAAAEAAAPGAAAAADDELPVLGAAAPEPDVAVNPDQCDGDYSLHLFRRAAASTADPHPLRLPLLLRHAFTLWAVPLAAGFLWLVIPLDVDNAGMQNYYIFSCLWHPIYVTVTLFVGFQIMAMISPLPNTGVLALLAFLLGYIPDMMLLFFIGWAKQPADNPRTVRYVSMLSLAPIALLNIALAFIYQVRVLRGRWVPHWLRPEDKWRKRTLALIARAVAPGSSSSSGGDGTAPQKEHRHAGSARRSGSAAPLVDAERTVSTAAADDGGAGHHSQHSHHHSPHHSPHHSHHHSRAPHHRQVTPVRQHRAPSKSVDGASIAKKRGSILSVRVDGSGGGDVQDVCARNLIVLGGGTFLSLDSSSADLHLGDVMRRQFKTMLKVTMLLVSFLVMYVYCQLFSQFYFDQTEGQPTLQIVLSFLFGLPIFLIGNLQKVIASSAERNAASGSAVTPMIVLSIELFHQVFYKFLFTGITAWSVFAIFMALNLFIQILTFPMRCTETWFALRTRVNGAADAPRRGLPQRVLGWALSALGERGEVSLEDYRTVIAGEYLFTAMAQRISVVVFAMVVNFTRNSYNGGAYPFGKEDIDALQFSQINNIILAMFLCEWLASTVIHISLLLPRFGGFDTIKIGTGTMVANGAAGACSLIALHITMDVILFRNRHTFQPW
jgi:hypothetical protein